jgi:hypothetical protein
MPFGSLRRGKAILNRASHILALLGLLLCAHAACADTKSIFDDDWTASSQKKPPTAPPQPGAQQPGSTSQLPPVTPPQSGNDPRPPASSGAVRPPTPSAVVPQRQVVPPNVKLEKSRALLREAFARQLADKSPAARAQLCTTLLDAAEKASSDPSDQYVLLGGALNAAREAGDLRKVMEIAQTMSLVFWVDPQSIITTSALNMSLKSDMPNRSIANVTAGLGVVDYLVARGDLADAGKLCVAMRPAAAADKNLLVVVNRRAVEVESIRLAHERILPALTKLESQPDDPAANLAVGSFKCFSLGNWAEGLPLLAKSSDANLKTLAAKELTGPKTADDVLALADGWWNISER